MPSEVKPCPFCGHPRVLYRLTDGYKWGAAMCGQCGATACEVRTGYNQSDDAPWHARALEEWNTRAAPSRTPEDLRAIGVHLLACAIREGLADRDEAAWVIDEVEQDVRSNAAHPLEVLGRRAVELVEERAAPEAGGREERSPGGGEGTRRG